MIKNRIIPLLAASLAVLALSAQASTTEGIVRGWFENELKTPPGDNSKHGKAVTFFGGCVGKAAVRYSETGTVSWSRIEAKDSEGAVICVLGESTFGQPVGRSEFFKSSTGESFADTCLKTANAMLYYDQATTQAEKDAAAFRYKYFLYEKGLDVNPDTGVSEDCVKFLFNSMTTYWTTVERTRSEQAAQLIKDAVKTSPANAKLQHAALDILYDSAAAGFIIAQEKEADAQKYIVGAKALPIDKSALLMNIEMYQGTDSETGVLDLYSNAISGYFDLLKDPVGVDMELVDPTAGVPYGYYMFQKIAPLRSLSSPLGKDAEGNYLLPRDITEESQRIMIASGYKDLALILKVQTQWFRAATRLAKLLIARNGPDDRSNALTLIAETQRKMWIEGNILLNMFPEYAADTSKNPELADIISAWRSAALTILDLKPAAEGKVNLFGLPNEFCVFMSGFGAYDPNNDKSTADHILTLLDPQNASGLLGEALDFQTKAQQKYDENRNRVDSLKFEYLQQNTEIDAQLEQIVGVKPGETGYDKPLDNPAGELYEQNKKISIAQLQIEKNQVIIENLIKRVQIEVERRETESGLYNQISQIYIQYGEKQAALTEEIGRIQEKAQKRKSLFKRVSEGIKAAGEIITGIYTCNPLSVAKGADDLNSTIQAMKDKTTTTIAQKQAQKERLAALEKAEVNEVNNQILDVNSKASIKTWLLEMNSLELENEILEENLSIELSRMSRLILRKNDLEQRKALMNATRATSYAADPVHRLKENRYFVRSQFEFEEAQLWVYFLIKAYMYKWNLDSTWKFGASNQYDQNSVFRAMNAEELKDIRNAIYQDNPNHHTSAIQNYAVILSLRQNLLGFRDKAPDDTALKAVNPLTGQLDTPLNAFRGYLKANLVGKSDMPSGFGATEAVRLTFSTTREISGIYQGTLFREGAWNEKIASIRFRVLGGKVQPSTTQLRLAMLGCSILRNQKRGVTDPLTPDRKVDEFKEYPTSFLKYDSARNKFTVTDPVYYAADAQLSATTDQWGSDITLVQEYSVANPKWDVYIQTKDSDGYRTMNIDTVTDIQFIVNSVAVGERL